MEGNTSRRSSVFIQRYTTLGIYCVAAVMNDALLQESRGLASMELILHAVSALLPAWL